VLRSFLRGVINPWLRLRSENTEVLNLPGATILAPVHRSNLDSALLATQSTRRIRALGKESLFTTPVVSYICAALGAIPVRRGEADRDALKAAKGLLDAGESMIVFPEGGRQTGPQVTELFDGAAWLAARTGARVIPVGIAGTEAAMPQGAKMLKRSTVAIVPGDPMDPPVGIDGKRANRQQLQAFTAELADRLQKAQDRAEALAVE
jgi:1-acyl-sn-glycerol-3-phosphate acyltransferase